jgi:molybdopterin-guanine dinucleotide biosynthesis protein A
MNIILMSLDCETATAMDLTSSTVFAQCSVLILAGGQGRRMGGQDKGWLQWQGRALIEHVYAVVRPLCDDLIISCNRNQAAYAALADRLVSDSEPGYQGPLLGIIEAMRVVQNPHLMILACDAAAVDRDLLARLYEGRTSQPLMYKQGSWWQPLLSIVPTLLLHDLEQQWSRGQRSPKEAFLALGAEALEAAQDDGRLTNFNCPEMLSLSAARDG